jgi:hypothetical protein
VVLTDRARLWCALLFGGALRNAAGQDRVLDDVWEMELPAAEDKDGAVTWRALQRAYQQRARERLRAPPTLRAGGEKLGGGGIEISGNPEERDLGREEEKDR